MSGQSFGGATLTSLGSGWWRISLTGTLPESGATAVLGVLSGGARSFAGNGSSAVYVWGPSLTQGLDARPFALTQGAVAGPQIFNPPASLTQNSRETWAALAGGPNWGGADVYISLDGGSTYEFIGSASQGASRYGALTASFPAGSDPDTANTCDVDLSASATGAADDSGALTTAPTQTADGDGTLCLINDSSPELISYSAAPPTAANRFAIGTYTRRGQLGTPIGAHSAQAPFIRLDAAPFVFPFFASNIGATVYAKFASFNLWGQGQTPLQNCVAYPFTPAALKTGAPGSSAWSVSGGTLSNAGQSVPALLITGAPDNPAAQQVVFFYKPTGSGAWISAGAHPAVAYASFPITSVAPEVTYDVGVAYIVQGSLGQIETMSGSPATAGQVSSGGSSGGGGSAPGTVLLDSFVAGSWSFTCPSGSYGHVDIEIWGADGGDWWTTFGGGDNQPGHEGGSGAYAILTGQAATPGTTAFSGAIGTAGFQTGAGHGGGTVAGAGGATSVSSPAMNVGGGVGATNLASGAGGAVGAGGTQTAGVTGAGTESNGRVRITARA